MKIRNGFVSNSSSSSFILDNKYKTSEIAITMLEHLDRERDDYNRLQNEIKKYKTLINNYPDLEDINTFFPWSTNYDTYIFKHNNLIYINTCNNDNFYIVLSEYISGSDDEFNRSMLWFYDISCDLLIQEPPDYKFCKEHFRQKVSINKITTCCPCCYTGERYSKSLTKRKILYPDTFNLRR